MSGGAGAGGGQPPLATQLEDVGINRASTFNGFCTKHDNAIFSPLEDTEFDATQLQAFLLGYRASCLEVFKKDVAYQFYSHCLKKYVNGNARGGIGRMQMEAIITGNRLGLKSLIREKEAFDESLMNDTHSEVRYMVIEFSEYLPFLMTVCFAPEFDLNRVKLQDLTDARLVEQDICFSTWNANGHGYAVFTLSEKDHDVCKKYVSSIIHSKPKYISNWILNLAFQHTENIYFNRDWWDALKPKDSSILISRAGAVHITPEQNKAFYRFDGQSGFTCKSFKISGNFCSD